MALKDMLIKSLARRQVLKDKAATEGHDVVNEVKNWYSDRYETLLVHRNILFLFVILAMASLLAGVFVIGEIASSKEVIPFIVEIEPKTGITNVVDPAALQMRQELSANASLNTFFVMQYIRSRETFSPVDYKYNYEHIVRLLSVPRVYGEFQNFLRSKDSPISTYGNSGTTTSLVLRSLQYLDSGTTVRFTIKENNGSGVSHNKIATMGFEYRVMELTPEEREVNPLGFQVTSYKVDPDNN